MKKTILSLLLLGCLVGRADEGMWIPLLLKKNEADMQAKGLTISAEDIYSANHSGLKDAILLFGGGCTASFVSEQGLIFTNYHCGHGAIQALSSLEHDYLTNGFWAAKKADELPCEGLTVTSLIRMEDVTIQMMQGIDDSMDEKAKNEKREENKKELCDKAVEGTHYQAKVVPFYNGNQYFLYVNEVFKDVRLVGAPPAGIGKFGGDTDNWMWPRHTGDFCVFRVYADQDNKAAEYHADNKPFKPRHSLTVNNMGAKENDFTFVFGYPARTQEYLPSYAIKLITETQNNIRIEARTKRLNIINQAMDQDPLTRIQYSAKAAGISNGWKKWQGENKGIKRVNGIEKKEKFEQDFQAWANQYENGKYKNLLPELKTTYEEMEAYSVQQTYFTEHVLAPEIVSFTYQFSKLIKLSEDESENVAAIQAEKMRLLSLCQRFYKNINPDVDKKIFKELSIIENSDKEIIRFIDFPDKNFDQYVDQMYAKSIFMQQTKIENLIKNFSAKDSKKILADPMYQYVSKAYGFYRNSILPALSMQQPKLDSLQRVYMQAQMDMQPEKNFYPDANSTLRVSYGKIEGYQPSDAVTYKAFSTLKGVMEKENPDVYDYQVDPKLKALYEAKDYGPLGTDEDGEMPLAFVASNHTTGGNSGSPVLDGSGNLIGLNFDRCWEGTMSDIMYDPDQCRNIVVDIRYCIFIIEKFANAPHLLQEMKLLFRGPRSASKPE